MPPRIPRPHPSRKPSDPTSELPSRQPSETDAEPDAPPPAVEPTPPTLVTTRRTTHAEPPASLDPARARASTRHSSPCARASTLTPRARRIRSSAGATTAGEPPNGHTALAAPNTLVITHACRLTNGSAIARDAHDRVTITPDQATTLQVHTETDPRLSISPRRYSVDRTSTSDTSGTSNARQLEGIDLPQGTDAARASRHQPQGAHALTRETR